MMARAIAPRQSDANQGAVTPVGCGVRLFPFPQHLMPSPSAHSMASQKFGNSLPQVLEVRARELAAAFAELPFFKPFLSLHSHFRRFNQTQCRVGRRRNLLSDGCFAAIMPGGDSVAGLLVANGINSFLNIYNTLLVVRLVLTWFPSAPPAIVSPLSTLCDPYLNIFRGIIPPLGGTLDLSPILAFLVLNAFTSTAAALPAELPEATIEMQTGTSPLMATNLSSSQRKWLRRICSRRTTKTEDSQI